MEEKFIIAGGIPRKYGELMSYGHVLREAEIATIDYDKKEYTSKLKYIPDTDFCPEDRPSVGFTSFSIHKEKIYIATSTQVLIISLSSFEILEKINDPLFNDIHHVKIINNNLYVVVTGLDALFEYDLKTKNRTIFNTLGKDPFHRFDKDKNLNKVVSTKPHESHPNHVFAIGDEVWVTRFQQKDAVCITDMSKRMDIGVGFPHDGFVKDGVAYFTTVNGYVVGFDTKTFKKVIDIKLTGKDSKSDTPLGWCRGLYVEDDFFFVGFTQLRTTKVTENLAWLKTMIKEKKILEKPAPTRIEKYTIDGRYVSQFELPSTGVFTIFSIEKI